MSDKTHIEWTDATWNPITGCDVVSAGCTNCYAMKLAGTRLAHTPSRQGLTTMTRGGPVWNGSIRFNDSMLDQPLRWQRPRRIFVCAHGDLFHKGVPDEWIDQVFAVAALSPQHTLQILTKRPERMRAYMSDPRRPHKIARAIIDLMIDEKVPRRCVEDEAIWPVASIGDIDLPDDITLRAWPLPNVWLGVSIENQATADERIPPLLNTPAAIRFVSAEPLLGPVDLTRVRCADENPDGCWRFNALQTGDYYEEAGEPDILTGKVCYEGGDGPERQTRLDWIICGGESGPKARSPNPVAVFSLRDQCAAAGTAFFFKQWGEWAPYSDTTAEDIQDVRYGEFHPDGEWIESCLCAEGVPGTQMFRVGKKAAGALLDGVQHHAFPEVG